MFHDLQICHILMYSFLAYVLCLRVCACSLTHLSNAVEGIEVELLARVEEKKFTHTVFVLAGHGRHLNWGQFFPEQWLTARSTVLRGFHVLVRAFFGGKLGSQLGWGTFRGSHLASGHNMIRIHFRFRSHRKSAKVPAGRPARQLRAPHQLGVVSGAQNGEQFASIRVQYGAYTEWHVHAKKI